MTQARFQNNPAQSYRDIRRQHGPVAPVLLEGDVPAWLVLGYRELLEVTGDSRLFARDSRRWNAWYRVPADWPLMPILVFQPSSLFTEGAEHRRRADLVNQYARPIPLLAIAWMLGVPEADASELVRDMSPAIPVGRCSRRRNRASFATAGGNHAHVSFSHGEHGCPYPARERRGHRTHRGRSAPRPAPGRETGGGPDALVWRQSMLMRVLSALPVTFSPVYVAGGVEQE